MDIISIIAIAQIFVAAFLVAAVLLQQKGVGLGSAFGAESIQVTRRGPEKVLFNATVILSILFLGLGLVALFIQ